MLYKSRPSRLAIDKFPDETIIVDLQSGSYYSLRGGAHVLWTYIEEGIDEQHIYQVFEDLSDTQKQQLIEFFDQLKDSDLIVQHDFSNALSGAKRKFEPLLFEKFDDMQELILLDPIHEVDARGWPHQKNEDANE